MRIARGRIISNIDYYGEQDVIQEYASYGFLFKPEETILNLLRPKLKDMKMLDIGVGGGRTTCHFATLTKEYTGIDHSSGMIRACKERFSNASSNISFMVCDVRNMETFEDGYFDFVLFSFNGIDEMDHRGRIKALSEIRRVCKRRGIFCFSSHNLNGAGKVLSFIDAIKDLKHEHPTKLFPCLKLIVKEMIIPTLNFLNLSAKELKQVRYAMLIDDMDRFRLLKRYYIRPEEQIDQLVEVGFQNVRVYSLDGEEIRDSSNLKIVKDYQLYYLCYSN